MLGWRERGTPVYQPRRDSGNGDAPRLEHAVPDAECRKHAQTLMDVVLQRLAAQTGNNVHGQKFALPDSVLGVRHGTCSRRMDT
jgi:hypothetical protein